MAMRKNLRNLKPNLFITASLLIFLIPLGFYFLLWVPERKDLLSQRYLRLVAVMSDQFENRGTSIQRVNNKDKTEGIFAYCEDKKNELNWKDDESNVWKKTEKIKNLFDHVYLSNEFDDILLVRKDGEIIYRKSGVAAKGIDSSLHIANIQSLKKLELPEKKDTSPMIVHPNFMDDSLTQIIELDIAKNRYLLFLQPIPLKFVNQQDNVAGIDKANGTGNIEITDNAKGNGNNRFPWYIGGLLAKKEFQRRSRKISGNILWIFSLLLFLFLISLPVVKLIMMGPSDRIKVWDMIFVGISLLIGIPLILYLIAFGASGLINESGLDQELEGISDKIRNSFLDEIEDVRDQLVSLLPEESTTKREWSIFEKKRVNKYHFLDMIFLINTKEDDEHAKYGHQVYKGVPYKKNNGLNLLDVSDREYFKRIKDKDYWFTRDENPIMLQTVYSKSSGVYELNLSMPHSKDLIAGVSFRPLSVLKPVLPYGLGFAIIDRSGRVIFHSNQKLNFYENFFSECNKSDSLRSTIWGRTARQYNAYYQGRNRTFYVRPIQNIPWTLIVFRDNDISASHNLDSIIHASILFWIYGLCLIILVSVCLLGCLFQKKILPSPSQVWHRKFRWLWPDSRLNYEYSWIATFNITLFVLLFFYSYFEPSLWLFLIPVIIICFNYILIQKSLCKLETSTSANPDSQNGRSFSQIKNFTALIFTGSFLIVLIVFLKYRMDYDFPYEVILSVFILCLISLSFAARFKPDKIRESRNYKKSFSFALYSLILLFVALPALSSFRMIYKQAQLHCLKIKQVNLARSRVEWDHTYNKNYEIYPGLDKEQMYDDAVNYGVYSKEIELDNRKEKNGNEEVPSYLPSKLCNAICNLIPTKAEYTEQLFHLALESGPNFDWKYDEDESKLRLTYKDIPDVIYDESGITGSLIIESNLPKPDLGNRLNLLILSIKNIAILLFLSIVLFPLVSLINKVIFPHRRSHGFLEESVIYPKNNLSPGKYIIMGSSKDLSKWKENFCLSESCQLVDCSTQDLHKKFTKYEDWIILKNFDYRSEEAKTNLRKIKLLEEINARGADNIVILSQYEPLANFQMGDENNSSQHKSEEESQNAERVEERLMRLLKNFKKRYVVEEEENEVADEEKNKKEKESKVTDNLRDSLKNLLDTECGDSIYLKSIRNRIYDEFNNNQLSLEISETDLEDMIFEYASPVYDSIWRASSNEEKYCMICLAFDGMVNLKNDDVFRWLLNRKLIKLTPLNLFNKTFRRFVRASSDTSKILGWQSKQIDSMWTKLKRPVMFLLFGLILFFAITQPNLIKTWLLIIPVLSGAIPALLRMIEQISKGTQGSAS